VGGDDRHDSVQLMLTYSREQLFALDRCDLHLDRQVRKSIFRHDVWLPRELRAREFRQRHSRSADDGDPRDRRRSVHYGLLNAQSIGNKSTIISNVIVERRLDVLLLTETWHTAHDDVPLLRCVPPGYTHIDVPRPSDGSRQNHGGVAAIITSQLTCRVIPPPRQFRTFESVCFSATGSGQTVVNLLIYRPGSLAVTDIFFTELIAYLEVLALYKCQIVIAGDFNIHSERHDNSASQRLADIMFSFDCVQHVPATATHVGGGTIDLLFTKSDEIVEDVLVDAPGSISDHSLIRWCIPVQLQPVIVLQRQFRAWKSLDVNAFRSALSTSDLCDVSCRPDTAEEYFDRYERTLRALVDKYVPVKTLGRRRQRLVQWMDTECFQLRRESRRLEKRYRRSLSAADRLAWVQHERKRHAIYRRKEFAYWNLRLSTDATSSRKLWGSLSQLMGGNSHRQTPKSVPAAQQLLDFFNAKVEAVRQSTTGSQVQTTLSPSPAVLNQFNACTTEEVMKTISASKPKTCELDPLPTDVLRQFLPELLPFITDMCNVSLQQGCLPLSQRRAIIMPRLKKSGLDQADVKNYRPVSNLTFMSKIVERLVCRQLTVFLNENNLLPRNQSAYRPQHSTETAVLKVVSDLLAASDRGQVSLLALLDLSAAFDTVDHCILLDRLQSAFGISGAVLDWIRSFVTERCQTVRFNGETSTETAVVCGVPQGSVLGPILFLLYCADIVNIAQRCSVSVHSYADDTQLYVHCKTIDCSTEAHRLVSCIEQLNSWMMSNRLKLNADKTQFLWCGSAQQRKNISVKELVLMDHRLAVSDSVTCLGILIDADLSFAPHVKRVSAKCFYHLRQLWTIRPALSADNAKMLALALIASRVDYCNSILYRVPAVHVRPLQLVLNAAARFVVKKRRFDHITATIRDELHWLPVRQRITYKLCWLVYKCLHLMAPIYLSEMCVPVSNIATRERLRSATRGDLAVPTAKTTSYGLRTFSAAGPSCWNSLHADIRGLPSIKQFCCRLKTELFRQGYAGALPS